MPQHSRFYCDRCGQSVWHSHVQGLDGEPVRCPIVVYVVAGQPADTGDPVDLNTVKVPQYLRDLMAQPVARRDLCVNCFAEEFGLEMVPPHTER
jgi:hypothetical protein